MRGRSIFAPHSTEPSGDLAANEATYDGCRRKLRVIDNRSASAAADRTNRIDEASWMARQCRCCYQSRTTASAIDQQRRTQARLARALSRPDRAPSWIRSSRSQSERLRKLVVPSVKQLFAPSPHKTYMRRAHLCRKFRSLSGLTIARHSTAAINSCRRADDESVSGNQ